MPLFLCMLNNDSQLHFILLNEEDIVAQEVFTIDSLIQAYPSFWNLHKGDYEAFTNLCLDDWCKQREGEGIQYNVGTFQIDRNSGLGNDNNNIFS